MTPSSPPEDSLSPARRANLRDVAERAGVAVSSASRVLSDHPDVSPAMRRRVLAAVEELDYEPDFLAQSLRLGATFSVGFLARDISSPLLAAIALGAEKALRAGGYHMLVLNTKDDGNRDGEYIRVLERRRVDGLLISLVDESHPSTISALRELSVPAVLIDRDVPDAPDASAVLADHESGTSAVVDHLAALGHSVVGLAAGPPGVRPGREGARAFRAVCGRHSVEAVVDAGPFSPTHGFEAAQRMLDRTVPPTALIAGSNQILPGVLRAIRARGLVIPDQISLVTFDDLPLLDLLEPPVDVVTREPEMFGRIAGDLLLRRLGGRTEPETVEVPTVFAPRGSSAPPPA